MLKFIFVGLFICLLLFAFESFAQGDQPPTLVVAEPVVKMEFNDQVKLVGRTEAKKQSKIVAEIVGRVTAINAVEGNWASKGSPLVTIDSTRLKLSLIAKEAEVTQAKAQAELAKSNLKRIKELYSQTLVSETTHDSAIAWVNITEARYNELDAQREQLRQDVDNCVIRAPYGGYTLRKQVDVGEWVATGTPVYEMVDISELLIVVDLPEKYFRHLEVGSHVDLFKSSAQLQGVSGKVTGIARSASEETHTYPVIVTVNNDKGLLGGGELIRVSLSLIEKSISLAVSKDAIVRQGPTTAVYTVVEGKANMIPVQIKATSGEYVAVTGQGLDEGALVVIRGNERIFPGSPVTTGQDQKQN